jgi:tRNA-(ms[2]io[6]A)-hydroxylase
MALLSDHAYLERKAASNALELLNRWPEPGYPEEWTTALAGIARDESMHLNTVLKLIRRRGGRLARLHRSTYAADLRQLVRRGQARDELVDRLLVSGLIEARSCERFLLLERACEDRDLQKLYASLGVSEFGHHTLFLRLAGFVRPADEVDRRWKALLASEAEIIQRQEPGPGIHSGVPA